MISSNCEQEHTGEDLHCVSTARYINHFVLGLFLCTKYISPKLPPKRA